MNRITWHEHMTAKVEVTVKQTRLSSSQRAEVIHQVERMLATGTVRNVEIWPRSDKVRIVPIPKDQGTTI